MALGLRGSLGYNDRRLCSAVLEPRDQLLSAPADIQCPSGAVEFSFEGYTITTHYEKQFSTGGVSVAKFGYKGEDVCNGVPFQPSDYSTRKDESNTIWAPWTHFSTEEYSAGKKSDFTFVGNKYTSPSSFNCKEPFSNVKIEVEVDDIIGRYYLNLTATL